MTPATYLLGLALGQLADYSALAILERQNGKPDAPAVFLCRHLQRWTPRTPYAQIAADLAELTARDELKAERAPLLAVDATGTGQPVVGLLRQELKAPAGKRMAYAGMPERPAQLADVRPVVISAGDTVAEENGLTRIPKRDLVTTAQMALQAGRFKIAPGLREADTLRAALVNFKLRVNINAAADTFEPHREGADDGIVFAACVALWFGEQRPRRLTVIEW